MKPKATNKDHTEKERKNGREHRNKKREHRSILCCSIPRHMCVWKKEYTSERANKTIAESGFCDGGVF
jgi:hypothetical protein